MAVYAVLPLRGKNLLLTLASYLFYGWWRPDFVFLMLFSTVVDFYCARRMGAVGESRKRKPWLWLSMLTNLGLLAYFKYANLLVESVEVLSGAAFEWEAVILPVGISFYTFQSMSYTIDVYRGRVQPVRSFLDLACYVSMFPQLVAGPIVRYADIAEQLTRRSHSLLNVSSGVFMFMIGFTKKMLVADHVAPIVDRVFDMGRPGFIEAWTGVSAYAAQIYFDFSAYSDMAIGLGLMLGFTFPRNFDSPYKSQSITEFWRRWHVSLSSWLRDYLYIPLGGSRLGELRTYINLSATMLLGGLWHGASWTFLLWGAYQGAFLVVERLFGKRPVYSGLPAPLRVACTFVIVLGGWAIFRAESMTELASIYSGMFGVHGIGTWASFARVEVLAFYVLAIGLVIAFFGPQSWDMVHSFRPLQMCCVAILFALAVCHLAAGSYSPFIYFQF